MVLLLPVLIALIGLLMYALSANGRLQNIGLVSYGVGLLAFLLRAGPEMLKVL